jgi:hypothetical protein
MLWTQQGLDRWNSNKDQGSSIADTNIKATISKFHVGDWRRTIDGEGEFKFITKEGARVGGIF